MSPKKDISKLPHSEALIGVKLEALCTTYGKVLKWSGNSHFLFSLTGQKADVMGRVGVT